MLTPQEIQEKGFKKAVFGGYDAEEVDEFLEAVENDYASLYRENAVLKSKMRVLVDKLEQYRNDEGNIRDALSNAQQKSEDMYRETREKCRRLTRDTEEKAKKTIAEAQAKVAAEERRLANISADCDQFVAAIRKVMDKQTEYLNELAKTGEQLRAENNIKRPAPQQKKPAKKPQPAPKVPQPDIRLDLDDSADTETAEKINDIVSSVMNEKKFAKAPVAPTTVVSKKPQKAAASVDDKFDFKNMKFN